MSHTIRDKQKLKARASKIQGGSIRYWGGVESDCRINTKNYYHDRIYNSSSPSKMALGMKNQGTQKR